MRARLPHRFRRRDKSSSYCHTHAGILGIVSLVELAANGIVIQERIISSLPPAVFSLKHHGTKHPLHRRNLLTCMIQYNRTNCGPGVGSLTISSCGKPWGTWPAVVPQCLTRQLRRNSAKPSDYNDLPKCAKDRKKFFDFSRDKAKKSL